MSGAEGVVHVDVAQTRERGPEFGHFGGVGLLAGAVLELHFALFFDVETEVFEEQDLARPEGLGGGFGLGAHAGRDELHRLAKELLELGGHGTQGELLDDLAVRTAEVGHQHQGGAAFEQEPDRRQGRGDTLGVRDDAGLLVLGDVEVHTDEDTLALDGAEFAEGRSRHGGERLQRKA